MALTLLTGFLLALLIAFIAFRVKALSRSGALAALGLGTVIFGLGGLSWAVLLLAFFISSSTLSRLFKRRKSALDEKFSKGSQRDAGQVLANGGVAGVFAILHAFFPQAGWTWIGCAAALAAANADTWATELGVLNPGAPILITSGRPVERGTSGGISPAGTLAALAGAAFVALFAALGYRTALQIGPRAPYLTSPTGLLFDGGVFGLAALGGLAGSLVDSLLGATLQAIYYCPACQKETERHPQHTCGTDTRRVRGLAWLDNDWVNTACTLSGALLAVVLFFIFGGL